MDIKCCYQDDKDYPILMKNITKPPNKLFFCGDIGVVNEESCIAIVGSRKASENSLKVAYEYGRIAAKCECVTVNGLAIGCDTQALRGALSQGGKCVVVMPGGLDEIYPKSNEELAKEIVDSGGCIISEYEVGVRPRKYTYVERDRLQSGISKAVVVIETSLDGGTMHTVKSAEKQNKRLAVYYTKLFDVASGNKEIIKKGRAIPVDNEQSMEKFLAKVREDRIETYEQLTFDLLQRDMSVTNNT